MGDFPLILQLALVYGGILSAVMTAFIFGTLYWRPMIWLHDAPADVQAAAGPISRADARFKRVAGIAMMLFIAALLTAAVIALGRATGELRFLDVALLVFLIIQVFNVVDLVIIDWLFIVWLRPSFLVLPGTEDMASYDDYGFHFRGFLKGVAGSAVAALPVAAVVVGVAWLWG